MASSTRSFAAGTCLLALLLAGCLAAARLPAADARRLLATAMPPTAGMDYYYGYHMAPAQAPVPESGADYYRAGGRMLSEARGLLDGGLRLAGRLFLGLGL